MEFSKTNYPYYDSKDVVEFKEKSDNLMKGKTHFHHIRFSLEIFYHLQYRITVYYFMVLVQVDT